MIPILYDFGYLDNTERPTINNDGIGYLTDCISCEVSEERNGSYTLELEYPINGVLANELVVNRVIVALPYYEENPQQFYIVSVRKTLAGTISVDAVHVSYRLDYIFRSPILYYDIPNPVKSSLEHLLDDSSFIPHTNMSSQIQYSAKDAENYRPAKQWLVGTEGSIIDKVGGELYYDNYDVYLLSSRGTDKGVVLYSGINIIGFDYSEDISNVYTEARVKFNAKIYVPPIEPGGEGQEITYPQLSQSYYSSRRYQYPFDRAAIVDSTIELGTNHPDNPQLQSIAEAFLSEHSEPIVQIDIDFVRLSDSPEWEKYKELDLIKPWDTITVDLKNLGMKIKAKVQSYTFDVLKERYKKVNIGNAKISYVRDMGKSINNINRNIGIISDRVNGVT